MGEDGPGNRWAIREQGDVLLSVTASQGMLRSSAHLVVERTMPEEAAVLLCLIAGYLTESADLFLEPGETIRAAAWGRRANSHS